MNDSILDKLAKIKRHADSAKEIGSDAEAQAFAELLQRMLIEHKLDMTDLEFEQMEKTEEVDRHYIDYSLYPDVKVRKVRVEWVERLASIVARAHFCRILVHPSSSRITLVGRKSDVAVTEFMFITLQRLLERMSDKKCYHYKLQLRREKKSTNAAIGYRETYLAAFITRLAERYDEQRKAAASESTALVRLNTADAAVAAWFDKARKEGDISKKKLVSHNGRITYNPQAHQQGILDANNVNLRSNAVGTGASSVYLPR